MRKTGYSGERDYCSDFCLRGRPPLDVARIASTAEGSYKALYEMGFMPALSSLL